MMVRKGVKSACILLWTLRSAVASPQVTIGAGTIVGTATAFRPSSPTAHAYLGIPFAKPPTRFMPPEPADAIVGTLDATRWPAGCIQQSPTGFIAYNESDPATYLTGAYNLTESEDCLYLNLFTPTNATVESRLPVMFWIYGGNLQTGSSSLVLYHGASLSQLQNVVVVTINYRVGVFGFIPSEELSIDSRNPGFLDQRLALEWVHSNVRQFGGDPSSITIMGQSAGGYSVKQLWANPPKPLRFRAAILESEALILPTNGWPTLISQLNCSATISPLRCVQSLSATVVKDASVRDNTGSIAANPFLYPLFPPTVDEVTNTDRPEFAAITGHAARIPLLFGSNGNESAAIGYGFDETTGPLVLTLLSNSSAIAALYPRFFAAALGFGAKSPQQATSHINNQFIFNCPISILSNTAAMSGYPTWRYLYNATFSSLEAYPFENKYGTYHSAEIFSVFGTYPSTGGQESAQNALSQYVQGVWASFVKDPQDSLQWPRLNSAPEDLHRIGQDNAPNGTNYSQGLIDYDCGLYDGLINSLANV